MKGRRSRARRAPARRRDKPAAAPKPARTVSVRAPAPVGDPLAAITARDLMREDVITIDQSAPLSEIERILVENKISGAPVADEAGAIIGVVSMRDLIERYAEDPDARPRRGRGWFEIESDEEEKPSEEEVVESNDVPEEAEETARDVMSAEVYAVDAAAPVRDVARVMAAHGVHRVLVQEAGAYVGLVSTMDVLEAVAEGKKPPRRARRRGKRR